MIQVIKDVITSRRESKEKHGDFVDTMLEDMEKENTIFNEGSALSLIFSILVIAKEGVPNISSVALKFISENPKVLAELKVIYTCMDREVYLLMELITYKIVVQREHRAILRNREDKEGGVSWEEYRHNMSFTNMVINSYISRHM